jgi:hypothetical protein
MPWSRPSRQRRPWRPVVLAVAVLASVLAAPLAPPATSHAEPVGPRSTPVLVLPPEVTFTLGVATDSYVLEATGDPVPAIGVDRLPPGLRLIPHGDGSATLVGQPTGPAGTTTVWVRAQSAVSAVVSPMRVSVQQPPAFVDRGPLVFTAGEYGSVTVRTVGFPAPGLAVDGDLPEGLAFVDRGNGTATVFGTPLGGPQSAPVTLTAVNVVADVSLTTSVEVVLRPTPSAAPPLRPPGPRGVR